MPVLITSRPTFRCLLDRVLRPITSTSQIVCRPPCFHKHNTASMERWSGRVALVTGASAGIGASITKALVRHGMKVAACARNVDRIQAFADELKDAKGTLKPIKCDLRKEEDILAMFQTIKNDPDLGGVDVCVNNAGLAHEEPLLTGKTGQWREMFEVNVIALMTCTREAYSSMKERGVDDGHFVLLNSMSGHRVLPNKGGHVYSASKFAVSAILEGLRHELREVNSNIRVTSISPGLVETEFAFRMLKDDDRANTLYSSLKDPLNADDVKEAVVFALQTPPHVSIHDVLLRPTSQKS